MKISFYNLKSSEWSVIFWHLEHGQLVLIRYPYLPGTNALCYRVINIRDQSSKLRDHLVFSGSLQSVLEDMK